MLQGIYHCSWAFSFSVILLFFWLCASVLPQGHCVVVEAGCNWYHLGINIYSLSKKSKHVLSHVSVQIKLNIYVVGKIYYLCSMKSQYVQMVLYYSYEVLT
jgi:hypothetical protein